MLYLLWRRPHDPRLRSVAGLVAGWAIGHPFGRAAADGRWFLGLDPMVCQLIQHAMLQIGVYGLICFFIFSALDDAKARRQALIQLVAACPVRHDHDVGRADDPGRPAGRGGARAELDGRRPDRHPRDHGVLRAGQRLSALRVRDDVRLGPPLRPRRRAPAAQGPADHLDRPRAAGARRRDLRGVERLPLLRRTAPPLAADHRRVVPAARRAAVLRRRRLPDRGDAVSGDAVVAAALAGLPPARSTVDAAEPVVPRGRAAPRAVAAGRDLVAGRAPALLPAGDRVPGRAGADQPVRRRDPGRAASRRNGCVPGWRRGSRAWSRCSGRSRWPSPRTTAWTPTCGNSKSSRWRCAELMVPVWTCP